MVNTTNPTTAIGENIQCAWPSKYTFFGTIEDIMNYIAKRKEIARRQLLNEIRLSRKVPTDNELYEEY